MPKTIAIAGCTGRIGVTTQSVQAVLALHNIGFKACYLEMNRNEYLEELLALYQQAEDHASFVRYAGVDLYRRTAAKEVTRLSTDYIVRDYGQANTATFEESSFSEQPLKIIVCGSKPNEIFKIQELLEDPIYDDAFFIFTFVPEEERAAILPLMGDRAEKTYFSSIILDPFTLATDSIKLFQKILKS